MNPTDRFLNAACGRRQRGLATITIGTASVVAGLLMVLLWDRINPDWWM